MIGCVTHSVVDTPMIVIDKKPFSFESKAIDTQDQMLSTTFSHP